MAANNGYVENHIQQLKSTIEPLLTRHQTSPHPGLSLRHGRLVDRFGRQVHDDHQRGATDVRQAQSAVVNQGPAAGTPTARGVFS